MKDIIHNFLLSVFYFPTHLLEFRSFYDCRGKKIKSGDKVMINYLVKGRVYREMLCMMVDDEDWNLHRLRYLVEHERVEIYE
jgi:hypothetical protein